MRNVVKECINIFNKYGAICFGIAFIMLLMVAISFGVVACAVYVITWLLQLKFNFETAAIVWILCAVSINIYARRIERELKQKGEINNEEVR